MRGNDDNRVNFVGVKRSSDSTWTVATRPSRHQLDINALNANRQMDCACVKPYVVCLKHGTNRKRRGES